MKPRMMSKPAMDHLFHHILDGFKSSHQGIQILQQRGLVSDQEIADLLKKNNDRLIERIKEFKIIHRLVCIVFAIAFGYFQLNDDGLEMRRTSTRIRIQSSRVARRKTEQ